MAKVDLTPEEIIEKKTRRSNGWTRFWAIVLALVLVAGVTVVSTKQAQKANEAAAAELSSLAEENNKNAVAVNSSNTGSGTQSWDDGSASGSGDNAVAQTPEQADQAAEAANAINAATAAGVNAASYKWERHCTIDNINVGDKTEDINGIIHRIDSNADLNSVVGGFLGKGDKDNTYTKGADAKETFGNANYALIATSLQPGDLQGLKVEGNTYTFTLPNASNPQKDQSQALSRLTNDFITQQEVADGIKDALGALSFLLSVKSADAEFNDIQVKVVIKDGKLETLHYSYHMDVKSLALSVATGTGNGDIEATYSNFVY